jgi:hypothetical protein
MTAKQAECEEQDSDLDGGGPSRTLWSCFSFHKEILCKPSSDCYPRATLTCPTGKLDSQMISFPCFTLILLPEFLRELLATINVLRADEINRYFYTVRQVCNLVQEKLATGNEKHKTKKPDGHIRPV